MPAQGRSSIAASCRRRLRFHEAPDFSAATTTHQRSLRRASRWPTTRESASAEVGEMRAQRDQLWRGFLAHHDEDAHWRGTEIERVVALGSVFDARGNARWRAIRGELRELVEKTIAMPLRSRVRSAGGE